jgi:hypothetical protein
MYCFHCCVRLEEVDKVCQIIYFRLTSLYQKLIILIFVCNSNGNLPSSPSTIKLGVEDLTDITLLQNCQWIFSILDIHSKPHISEEYKRIGVKNQKVSIEDLLEWLNYIFFCRGHTELVELGLPFFYDREKITIVIEQ